VPLDLEAVQAALPGRRIRWFARVSSTMDEAARLAATGEADVVVADEQTAGRGRFGRAWHSEPEAGLYTTLILRPAAALRRRPGPHPRPWPWLPLRPSHAWPTCAATLRWPNDVLLEGKKVRGHPGRTRRQRFPGRHRHQRQPHAFPRGTRAPCDLAAPRLRTLPLARTAAHRAGPNGRKLYSHAGGRRVAARARNVPPRFQLRPRAPCARGSSRRCAGRRHRRLGSNRIPLGPNPTTARAS
jgi:hypothetical protein